jgi:hypothetical protein
VAVGLVALGRLFTGGGPIIPVSPTSTVVTDPSSSTTGSVTTIPTGSVSVVGAASFDPFGEGGENDQAIPSVLDGSASTAWRSERYRDPLTLQKPGVGLRFEVTGTPNRLQLLGLSTGTEFELYWAQDAPAGIDGWERMISASAPPGALSFTLAPRQDGNWLLWMTDIPQQPDGTYFVELAEVRFTS